MATADKLNYTKTNINQLKELTQKTVLSEVVNDIKQKYGNGNIENDTDNWKPEPDWWDIKTILENDTENYPAKVICLLTNELDDKAVTNTIKGADKYKLSDGQIIEATSKTQEINIDNLFDVTKDKECTKGYKTRYIIYLLNSESDANNLKFPNNTIYLIFSNTKLTKLNVENKKYLQAIKFIGSASATISNSNSLFYECVSLQEYPDINIEGSTLIETFYNCHSLKQIHGIKSNEILGIASAFNGCYSLERAPYIDISRCYSINTLFNNCYSLRQIEELNMKNINSAINVFERCNLLTEIKEIHNIRINLSLISCQYLKHSTLLKILNALVDLTGQTTKTLTLGSTNLAKLTDEEKAIATNKNWTLA